MKPFYVHINPFSHYTKEDLKKQAFRGATILITEEDDKHVGMQVTFCSVKDPFNKKEGHKYAHAAERKVVNKRLVPRVLAGCEAVVFDEKDITQWAHDNDHDYCYILRNFL